MESCHQNNGRKLHILLNGAKQQAGPVLSCARVRHLHLINAAVYHCDGLFLFYKAVVVVGSSRSTSARRSSAHTGGSVSHHAEDVDMYCISSRSTRSICMKLPLF